MTSNLIWICLLLSLNVIFAKYIDLTYDLHNDIPHHPLVKQFNMTITSRGKVHRGYWYQYEVIELSAHVGTHVDAPCHFAEGKWCISDIPFEHLVAPLIVVNITRKASLDPDALLTPDDLENWEKVNGKIPNGSVVVVYSGWGKFWPDEEKYLGTAAKVFRNLHYPGISPAAAEWLVNNTNIYGVGIDTVSIDFGQNKGALAHRTLYSKNIYGLENLANVDKLPAKGAKIFVMPIKIKEGSGAPARIFAEVDDNNS